MGTGISFLLPLVNSYFLFVVVVVAVVISSVVNAAHELAVVFMYSFMRLVFLFLRVLSHTYCLNSFYVGFSLCSAVNDRTFSEGDVCILIYKITAQSLSARSLSCCCCCLLKTGNFCGLLA